MSRSTAAYRCGRVWIHRPPLTLGFELPAHDELLALRPGDHVKLMFGDQRQAHERMWVLLSDTESIDWWSGTLDNEPVDLPIRYGDPVWFHPLDAVATVMAEDEMVTA